MVYKSEKSQALIERLKNKKHQATQKKTSRKPVASSAPAKAQATQGTGKGAGYSTQLEYDAHIIKGFLAKGEYPYSYQMVLDDIKAFMSQGGFTKEQMRETARRSVGEGDIRKMTDRQLIIFHQAILSVMFCGNTDKQSDTISDSLSDTQSDNLSDNSNPISDNTDNLSDSLSDKPYLYISDNDALTEAIALRENCEVLGIDTETTGLDPHRHRLRLIQIACENLPTLVIDCFKTDVTLIQPLLASSQIKVFHNAKFDLAFLLKAGLTIHQSLFDTQIAYQLLNAGKDNVKCSLKHLCRELLEIDLDKGERESDWNTDNLQDTQLKYAALDAEVLLPLRGILKSQLVEAELTKVSKIEFDAILAIAMMELNGILLDSVKWNQNLQQAIAERDKLASELTPLLGVPTLLGYDINLDSPSQLKKALNDRLGLDLPSTSVSSLKPHSKDFEAISLLLKYRKVNKLISSFGDSLLDKINPITGRVHPSYWQCGSAAGRFSCIAEGQKVAVPGGEIPIEKIKPGDHVYCYTEEGKLTISKVLNVIDNGIQEVVNVTWNSVGCKGRPKGNLICTPDHRIKTKDRGWVEAQNLNYGDKLYHLRKVKLTHNNRIRLYGTNKFQELEESVIKREYFKADSRMHCHHKDHDRSNNSLDNLEILTPSEHTSYHTKKRISEGKLTWHHLKNHRAVPSYGVDNPNWIHFDKYTLLKMLAKAKGRPTYVSLDFETFKRKCRVYGIDINAVARRYSSKGIYLSRGAITKALEQHRTTEEAALYLGIGTRKLKALCNELNIRYSNHSLCSVTPHGKARVYDLEVENHHNFIVSEICVHNCSNPNLQQIPRQGEVRSAFTASPGNKLVIADYSQIELRIAAEVSGDKTMIDAYLSNQDLHALTASVILNKDISEVSKSDRQIAKSANFGLLYGAGVTGFQNYAKNSYDIDLSEGEAKTIRDNFFKKYKGLARWHAKTKTNLPPETRTLSGRRRLFPTEITPQQALNSPVQGLGADILKLALARLPMALEGTGALILATVHDEIILEAPAERAEEVAKILSQVMVEAGKEFLKIVPVEAEASIGESWADK